MWLAAIAAATGPLALTPLGCVSFEDLVRTGSSTPPSSRCGECHAAIYEEWRESPHARAFLSETFLAHTDNGEIEHCLPCHAPGSLPDRPERPTIARHDRLDEGVHCLACHRGESDHGVAGSHSGADPVMTGPLGHDALVQPHAIETRERWFRNSEFCGRCHQDTYDEWLTASAQPTPTCQECHMPSVRRKVTQANDFVSRALVAFEPELELRAHTFDVDSATVEARQFLTDGFLTLRVTPLGGAARVTLHNHLPHALPTGEFGARSVKVRALVADTESLRDGESGDAGTVYLRTLRSKRGEALASGGELAFEVPVETSDASVRVEVVRVDAGGAAKELLARFDITDALSRVCDPAVDAVTGMARGTRTRRPRHGE